jgi:hypothetical protein
MRRLESGAGCGACGRGDAHHALGRPGAPPAGYYGLAARSSLTEDGSGLRKRRSATTAMSGTGAKVPRRSAGPAPKARPGTEAERGLRPNAAVERREATRPSPDAHAVRRGRKDWCAARRSAPLALFEGTGNAGEPGAFANNTGGGALAAATLIESAKIGKC